MVSYSAASLDTKEQIKRAINIVDLVGDYIPLRREGRGYKGRCPFHDDSHPSLQVNPERQSWKCWVCNVGGDIFNFVMKREGVEFREALTMLAERAGIALQPRAATSGAGDDKPAMYQAMAWAEQEFHRCLLDDPQAEPARNYLKQRGISLASIARYRLGCSPDQWEWLLQRGRGTSHSTHILEKIGLIAPRRNGPGHYDRFKGRVLFSIRDAQGRPVGIGGRVLPGAANTDVAKYINSPETPLFSKSQLLYGLDVARDAIAKSRTAVVMEGYTDCVMAQQCGFDNVVAVLGTALGERHVQLLKRYCDRVVLVLDGDEAGQRRTNEILDLVVAEQVDLQILTLPEGLDPCEFLQAHGADAFRDQLTHTVDALEHKFRTVMAKLGTADSLHATHQAVEDILATLALSPKLQSGTTTALRVKEDQILNRVSRRFGVPEETLRARLKELRRSSRGRSPHREQSSDSTAQLLTDAPLVAFERLLLEAVLLAPQGLLEVRSEIDIEQLQSSRARIIMRKCCLLVDAGEEPTFDRLMLEFEDNEIKSLLVELDEDARAKSVVDTAASLRMLLDQFRQLRVDREITANRADIQERRVDELEADRLYKEGLRLLKLRQGIALPMEG